MPRTSRKKSKAGIYHIILRGMNRQAIFEDDEDYIKFIQTLKDCKQKSEFSVYAYCLMSNHVHLLIKEGKEELGLIMRRIGAMYVYWYNFKYGRCGHLFQDRYKSEAVEDDKYLLTVISYIHNNPIKAGLVSDIGTYKWSSFSGYINNSSLIDDTFVLGLFSGQQDKAIEVFKRFHKENNNDACLDIETRGKITDNEAREIIKRISGGCSCNEIGTFEASKRNHLLKLFKNEGISTRQLERLTGIGKFIIVKAGEIK